MVTKEKKQVTVEQLIEKFRNANGFYFLNYSGMSVKDLESLRNEMKKLSVEMKVAKNTLLRKAIDEVGNLPVADEQLIGATAVVFGYEDALAPAKKLKEIIEKAKLPVFKGAVIEGQAFDSKGLAALAALPSKPEIMAGIIGSINAPISGIVGAINAVMRDLASLVEEVAKKQNNQ